MTNVCVNSLGNVSLPSATNMADAGSDVLVVDNGERVYPVLAPRGGEGGPAKLVLRVVKSVRMLAASEGCAAEIHIISGGTPIVEGNEPHLGLVEVVTRQVAEFTRPGNLVVLESTLPPMPYADLIGRPHEDETGLDYGIACGFAQCPERVLPGQPTHGLVLNDRIVGGPSESTVLQSFNTYSYFSES